MRKFLVFMFFLGIAATGALGLWLGEPRKYPIWSESTVITFTPKCGWKHVGLCINREGKGVGYGLFFQEGTEELPLAFVWEPPFGFWIQHKSQSGWEQQ